MYFCRFFALSTLLLHGAGTEAELIDPEPEVELFSAHLGPRYFAKTPPYGALDAIMWKMNDLPTFRCPTSFAHQSSTYDDRKDEVTNSFGARFQRNTNFNNGRYFHFDSQAYRRIDRNQAKNPHCDNSYHACSKLRSRNVGIHIYSSPTALIGRFHIYYSPTSVVCLSEMPMFKQLVINTKTDQLGDHDCGVFPP
ncbi:hypothetical protein, partial [Endozoicomonas numazuensis]|uniref:hypothetical protein n=1 Tax=Endozoicomonas numazuensis TaxID=1137799 RepID=UPI000557513E